jgi:dolichyl-phosphate-mannose-protein mannosyltransferase
MRGRNLPRILFLREFVSPRQVCYTFSNAAGFLMDRKLIFTNAFAIASVGLITYYPALKIGFVGTDWYWLEWVAKKSFPEYIAQYFDPRLQTGWWRPLDGLMIWLIYAFWKADPFVHHLAHVLLHMGNTLFFYFIVWRVSSGWRIAFLASVIYVGLPVYAHEYWISDQNLLAMFFYLAATWFWIGYLQTKQPKYYALTLGAFILTFLAKETGITLPITLFLVDRLLIRDAVTKSDIAYRYAPFVFLLVPYLAMEYWIQRNGMYVSYAGYGIGTHMVFNLLNSLRALAFPWAPDSPMAIVLLVVAGGVVLSRIVLKQDLRFAFLAVYAITNLVPVLGFPQYFFPLRYLYAPAMVSVILLSLSIIWGWTRIRRAKWYAIVVSGLIALTVFLNGTGVAAATGEWGEIARQRAVPFRDIVRAHPVFPEKTKLYFIESRSVTVHDLGVMFLLRYGANVTVDGTDDNQWDHIARLREEPTSYIYYFDSTGKPIEVRVAEDIATKSVPATPITFFGPIQLEGYEIANNVIKRGDALVLLLYWRALDSFDQDYTVFVHLVDADGHWVAGHDSQPRGGKSPTSAWKTNDLIVDGIVLPVGAEVPLGSDYRLEVGMYSLSNGERVLIQQDGQQTIDKLIIEPFQVTE